MTFVDDHRQIFDAADFCKSVTAGVGEGRNTSNLALRDDTAVSAAIKSLQHFNQTASTPVGPDVVAAYVTYSPGAPELFTALRAISVNTEIVSVALECLTRIVKYSLDDSKPGNALENARSIVKEIVKSRAVLIYDILATDGKAVAKKALNLLRLVAMCHPMLAKELMNRFDLSAKPMAPSLCSVTNNHCRVPFLDLMFVLLACGDRYVLLYLAGKGREVIITCLRTIQLRTSLEASSAGKPTPSLPKSRKGHVNKPRKILPSHVQKRELVAAINFLLAVEKHLFIGLNKSNRGAIAHPVPSILATVAATEIPSPEVAPREVHEEHEALRSTASRMFCSIAKDPRASSASDAVKALNQQSFNYGSEPVVKLVSDLIQAKPSIAKRLLESGRILSAPPALTLRWFGYFSVVSSCILRLQEPICTFKEKHFFEKCLSHADPLVRHLGCVLALSFCKVMEKLMSSEHRADNYLPSIDIVRKMVAQYAKNDDLGYRLLAAYQSLLQKHEKGGDVQLMVLSVDAAGKDVLAASRAIEVALKSSPYNAVRKVVHKQYLSKLISVASMRADVEEAKKVWRVCGEILRCTELFPPGTEMEIDVYLSVLSSFGKDSEDLAKAFEDMIAKALDMPYGLYDRLHSEKWREEEASIKTSLVAVSCVIKMQKLTEKRLKGNERGCDHRFAEALERIMLSIVASSSLLHHRKEPVSYLARAVPSALEERVWWRTEGCSLPPSKFSEVSRSEVRKLIDNRGTYPKTKFLHLIELLANFGGSTDATHTPGKTATSEATLAVAWDSWCDFWLSNDQVRSNRESWQASPDNELSVDLNDVVVRSLLQLLLNARYPNNDTMGTSTDLTIFRRALSSGDYRFAVAMLAGRAETAHSQNQLFEETLGLSKAVFSDGAGIAEIDFVFESLLRLVTRKSQWKSEQIDDLLLAVSRACTATSGSGFHWEIKLAYSIAILRAMVLHTSDKVSMKTRAFLSKISAGSLPSLEKMTPATLQNLFTVLDHSPFLLGDARSQVQQWSEKVLRQCTGMHLQLIDLTLSSNMKTMNDERFPQHEDLLERFIKASVRSKTRWVSGEFQANHLEPSGALKAIARKIALSRTLRASLLRSLFQSESDCSNNAWILLAGVMEPYDQKESANAFTDTQLESIVKAVVRHLGAYEAHSKGNNIEPFLQVLERALRTLRRRRFSFFAKSSSLEDDLAALTVNLISYAMAHLDSCVFVEPDLMGKGMHVKNVAEFGRVASLLRCDVEIFKLDLAFEGAAMETLVKIATDEGHVLRQCLRSQEDLAASLSGMKDPVIELMDLLQAMLPWLSHRCGEQVAEAILCVQRILESEKYEMASGRSKRHRSMRACIRAVSDYVGANPLVSKLQSTRGTRTLGTEASSAVNSFPKTFLIEAADFILHDSYLTEDKPWSASTSTIVPENSTKRLDPCFVLSTFLNACREALIHPQTPLLDLHRIAKDGILELTITGMASVKEDVRALSYACLQAFSAVVGPADRTQPGSASGLYKDRRQLGFLLEILRNSIPQPLIQVLPLFAVWFRIATRVVLSPGHTANKLVTRSLLRAPCLDVLDCYGLTHLFNCDASGPELQAARLLAFEVLQKGVFSQKDLSVVRKRRIFDKFYMFSVTAMGFDSSIRLSALTALEAMLKRDESLDVANELVGAHGMVLWLASSGKHRGESTDELLCKLRIVRCAADSFVRRNSGSYASVLFESLPLFASFGLSSTACTKKREIAARLAECGASISQINTKKRRIFGVDFADLWSTYMSGDSVDDTCRQNFVRCICRQRDTVMRSDILEMLLEQTVKTEKNLMGQNCAMVSSEDDLAMIHIYVAECIGTLRYTGNKTRVITAKLCYALAKALSGSPSIWLLLAAITTLDISDLLTQALIECTDRIPAYPPDELKPHIQRQCSSTVEENKLVVVDQLNTLAEILERACQDPMAVEKEIGYEVANGSH